MLQLQVEYSLGLPEPERTGLPCLEPSRMKIIDQVVTLLCVSLVAGAMLGTHVNQALRNEIAAVEALQRELEKSAVVGWWHIDPVTLQLYFAKK